MILRPASIDLILSKRHNNPDHTKLTDYITDLEAQLCDYSNICKTIQTHIAVTSNSASEFDKNTRCVPIEPIEQELSMLDMILP